ncbi:hypothetical protein ACFWNN_00385 [Lentzea sp. NPDC058450]|uniref:hypothetical protein n=1 Tax=Lentzea sp. NPDC058450 TaxID=3346505 RepID=UPI003669F401
MAPSDSPPKKACPAAVADAAADFAIGTIFSLENHPGMPASKVIAGAISGTPERSRSAVASDNARASTASDADLSTIPAPANPDTRAFSVLATIIHSKSDKLRT